MIQIYAGNELLYSPVMAEFGYTVSSADLELELNRAGSLKLTVPPGNPTSSLLKNRKDEIIVTDGDTEIWRGRVLTDERDFYSRRKIICEGNLSYLNDSVVRPYQFNGTPEELLKALITRHNEQMTVPFRCFTVGKVTVQGNISFSATEYSSTRDEIEERLLSSLGGYISIRMDGESPVIDYTDVPGPVGNQTIRFGENLLDLNEHVSSQDLYTVLIPLGKDLGDGKGKTTIASVNGGKDYIENSEAISLFGKIWKTASFPDLDSPEELLRAGKDLLDSGSDLLASLALTAVDLRNAGVNTDMLRLGHFYQIISQPHGLNRLSACGKVNMNLLNPGKNRYTFGFSLPALTDRQQSAQKQMASASLTAMSAKKAAESASVAADRAVSVVNGVMEQLPGSYVSMEAFSDYQKSVENNYLQKTTYESDLQNILLRLDALEGV